MYIYYLVFKVYFQLRVHVHSLKKKKKKNTKLREIDMSLTAFLSNDLRLFSPLFFSLSLSLSLYVKRFLLLLFVCVYIKHIDLTQLYIPCYARDRELQDQSRTTHSPPTSDNIRKSRNISRTGYIIQIALGLFI